MTLSLQFITMLVMVGSGIYLGLILDTFRRLLVYVNKRKILVFILEIIFWIIQAIILFYLLFRVNAGELRIYIFIAWLLGFSMYQALFKTIYLRLLERLLAMCILIIRFVFRLIEYFIFKPIKWLLLLCVTLCLFLFRMLFYVLQFIWNFLLFPIHLLIKKIKPLIPKKIIGFFHKIKGIYSTIKQILKNWLK